MLIDLTYRCNMGCNHCMSDCKPNGTDMTPEILKDVLAFCKKNEVPNLIFSGGEMFENSHICLKSLKRNGIKDSRCRSLQTDENSQILRISLRRYRICRKNTERKRS